ncbi:hypothetical protein RSOLAG1IB_06220 [Rhizoctonia solani AG-1 IB]|uniref:Peptidase C14 caspase domain-containing protein n=1 Tax=Thanatephorus cucumeris (strain AG1-IB / isolate 7/3/14) TaxID=1108050 RepID=A0A0B7F8M6_THACB|nr:hypothetical protein RSOLAG1IB_06220 [Rhizoctonia solani AG-1 IB]
MSATRRRLHAYALIIAINAHNLSAPEPDAYRLRDALVEIGIPENSIQLLVGAQATRNAIIQHLRSIRTNPGILKDAPIIIYFAGHGSRQRFPVPVLGTITAECIMPFDTLSTGGRVLPIPDITISALLGEIAKEKGDHITLLLDCCHSGSGSRDVDDNRGKLPENLIDIDQEEFQNEDGDIWCAFLQEDENTEVGLKSRSITTSHPGSLRYQGIKSHVLIASCREYEQSFEYSKDRGVPTGVFTSALMDALRDCQDSGAIWDVTYTGLFSRIKSFMHDDIQDLQRQFGRDKFDQTPQCEGYNRERHVFATPALPHCGHAIAPITATGRPDCFILPVSSLAGVRPDSEFEIYDYSRGRPRHKGRFRALEIDESHGTTTISNGQNVRLSPDAYAVLCVLPPPLHVDLSPDLHPIWADPEFQSDLRKRLNSNYSVDRFITLVRSGHTSKLRVSRSTSTGGVKVEPTDGRSRPIVLRDQRIPRISDTLTKAVMFYYHLERQVISSRVASPLDFRASELIESSPDDIHYLGTLMRDPEKEVVNFRPNEETHIYHSKARFGLSIKNHGGHPYYIYIFYFDPNDFSITPIYLPPTDSPSVPPGGELTIGYGNSGAAPLTFTVARGLAADPGFFKIFYSISPSEVGTIKQDGVDPNQQGDPRPGMPSYQQATPPYGSVLYPITVLSRPLGLRH